MQHAGTDSAYGDNHWPGSLSQSEYLFENSIGKSLCLRFYYSPKLCCCLLLNMRLVTYSVRSFHSCELSGLIFSMSYDCLFADLLLVFPRFCCIWLLISLNFFHRWQSHQPVCLYSHCLIVFFALQCLTNSYFGPSKRSFVLFSTISLFLMSIIKSIISGLLVISSIVLL